MSPTPSRALFEALLGPGPDAPALRFALGGGVRAWTRAGLAAEAEALGGRLAAALAGSPAGAVVAVLARAQEEQVLHVLACLAAGHVPAVLTPRTPRLDAAWYLSSAVDVLARIRPALIVTDLADDLAAAAPPGDPLPLTRLRLEGAPTGRCRAPAVAPPGTAFVQFSSGTTGAKKGVAVSLDAALGQLDAYGRAVRLRETALEGERAVAGDAIVSWLPLYHDMGFITAFLLPLRHRVFTSMLDPLEWVAEPGSYLREVQRLGATLGWHPNFALAHLARAARVEPGLDLSSLRLLGNCGEPVTREAQARFEARFAAHGLRPAVFAGCYAMAETTFAVTHGEPGAQALDAPGPAGGEALGLRLPLVSVGQALPGVEVEALDGAGARVPDGTIGELHVRAPFLASGYLENPEATGAAFVGGAYRTGDLGYLRGRELFVVGRAKDLLIVGGHNVFPEDVERLAGEAPGIRPGRAVAFAAFDERLQTEQVIVLAEPASGTAAPDLPAIAARIGTRIQAALNVSAKVHLVPHGWLVKSSSGKPARKASAEKWRRAAEAASRPGATAPPPAPLTTRPAEEH